MEIVIFWSGTTEWKSLGTIGLKKEKEKKQEGTGFVQDMLMNRPEIRKNESLGSRVRREYGMEA